MCSRMGRQVGFDFGQTSGKADFECHASKYIMIVICRLRKDSQHEREGGWSGGDDPQGVGEGNNKREGRKAP